MLPLGGLELTQGVRALRLGAWRHRYWKFRVYLWSSLIGRRTQRAMRGPP